MSEFNPRQTLLTYRRMSGPELTGRGYSPKSERFINAAGDTISRRQYENLRAQSIGLRNLREMQRETRRAKEQGFASATQMTVLRENEMYQAFERIYQLNAGGITLEEIHEFDPIANDFNQAMSNIIRSGEWRFRPDPMYAKFGYGLTYARLGPNVMHLFNLLELDFSRFDAEKRADWLRLY